MTDRPIKERCFGICEKLSNEYRATILKSTAELSDETCKCLRLVDFTSALMDWYASLSIEQLELEVWKPFFLEIRHYAGTSFVSYRARPESASDFINAVRSHGRFPALQYWLYCLIVAYCRDERIQRIILESVLEKNTETLTCS